MPDVVDRIVACVALAFGCARHPAVAVAKPIGRTPERCQRGVGIRGIGEVQAKPALEGRTLEP